MQSSGAPVTESAIYCQALMTAGGVKSPAVTSSQRHVQAYPTSHLVTNRSYTTSKLTSDHVSEMSVERPEMLTGTIPHSQSETKVQLGPAVDHSGTHQSKDATVINSNRAEYVEFIHPSSGSSNHSVSTSEAVKTCESPRLSRNLTSHGIVTSVKHDAVYSEIKDDNDDNEDRCTDMTLMPTSAAAQEKVTVERDKLLQRVSRLTVEKQEMVYKLRDFVETNGQLHYTVAELWNKLHEVESALEREQHEKALMSSRIMELTANERCVNREELSNNSQQLTLEGDIDSAGSTSSSVVQAQLWHAMQLVIEQQQQLETLRDVVERQNKYISRLCQRDVTLGLELRQTAIPDRNTQSDTSRSTSAPSAETAMTHQAAAAVLPAAAAVTEPVKQETEVVVSRRDHNFVPPVSIVVQANPSPTTSPRRAVVDAVFATNLPPPPPCDRRTRRSPPPPARPGIETPASRPTSHTAPARPLARPQLVPAAASTHSDLESLPVGFEMTTACPICQTPIPFDATSSDTFSRHVDECISHVTREDPTGSSRETVTADRTCPVCNKVYPSNTFSQLDFERHVNDHFADDDPASQQFEPMLS